MAMSGVLWIGGGSGAGKSTLARRLAYRHDLRLHPVDAYTFAHVDRTDPTQHPVMARAHAMGYHEAHVESSPEQQATNFIDYATERFAMVLDDVAARGEGPLVVVEGPQLLPHLVAPALASDRHGVWLLPTTDFTARSLGIRNSPTPLEQETDRERARRLRLRRDAILTDVIRRGAAERGLRTIRMDGSEDEAQSETTLEAWFDPVLTAGPRAGHTTRGERRGERPDRGVPAFPGRPGSAGECVRLRLRMHHARLRAVGSVDAFAVSGVRRRGRSLEALGNPDRSVAVLLGAGTTPYA
jgi:hypothetical protein